MHLKLLPWGSPPLRTKAGANEHCGALLRPERWCLQAPDGAVHYRSTAVSNPPSALSGVAPRGMYTSRGAVECHQSLLMSPLSKGETGLGTLSAVTHHCPFVGRFKLRFTRAVDGVPDSSSGRAYARLASPTPPQYPPQLYIGRRHGGRDNQAHQTHETNNTVAANKTQATDC